MALPMGGYTGKSGTNKNKGCGRLAAKATEVKASMTVPEREKEAATG